jgi:hypothetical protein
MTKKRYTLRGIGPPFRKQRELINHLFEPAPKKIKQVDLVCARAYGKSVLAIDIATRALSINGRQVGLFLEPDWKRVNRVFLRKWRSIVPPELYHINRGEQCIKWINGSLLYYGPRNITGSYQASEDSQLGIDTTFIIDDEAALRCSRMMYTNNLGTIRLPSDVRFYLTLTTPRLGDYKDLVDSKNHVLFQGRSSDNPYLPEGYIETLREGMSKRQARRDIDGSFESLEGMVWDDFIPDKQYPKGNRHWAKFNPDRPWYIAGDIGLSSAYLIIQRYPEQDINDRRIGNGQVDVVVGEFAPSAEDTRSTFMRIKNYYPGRPANFCTGIDTESTKSWVEGSKASEIINHKDLYWDLPILHPSGGERYKSTQFDRASGLVCTYDGRRRFLVSDKLVSHDSENRRGILELMAQDEYPDGPKRGDFLNKDGKLEHMRDALFYWAACMYRTTY